MTKRLLKGISTHKETVTPYIGYCEHCNSMTKRMLDYDGRRYCAKCKNRVMR